LSGGMLLLRSAKARITTLPTLVITIATYLTVVFIVEYIFESRKKTMDNVNTRIIDIICYGI